MTRKDSLIRFHARGVHRIWKKAVSDCGADLLVFSPYLTSGIAESVLGRSAKAQVHTVFDVENFASGASSLSTLRAIIKAGHALFHVQKLHAKVVLDPKRFVSIGSQNITRGGTRNHEITATFHDSESAGKVNALIAPWLEERVPITVEMIDEMEALFEPAALLFKAAQARAAELQNQFNAAQARRAEEELERLRLAEERRRTALGTANRLLHLQREIATRRRSRETHGWVEQQQSGRNVFSLMVPSGVDLTRWWVDGEPRDLRPFYRYLCIMQDTGKLGWARVARTRITYVEPEFWPSKILHIAHPSSYAGLTLPEPYNLRFNPEGVNKEPGVNLLIQVVWSGTVPICEVATWYAPGSLTILAVRPLNTDGVSPNQRERVTQWLKDEHEAFSKFVLACITSPFQYRTKRTGDEANTFFGEGAFRLAVMVENSHPVLVVSSA
jgi:hypothetical protein